MERHSELEPTKVVLVITVGFLALYFITKWHGAISISIIIGILGLSSSSIARIFSIVWSKIIRILSLIVPNILLTIIYFLLLTPLAYFSRLLKAPRQMIIKNTEQSFFKVKDKSFKKEDFEKMW